MESLGVVLAALIGAISSTFAGIFVWASSILQADSPYIAFASFYVAGVMLILTYKNLKVVVETSSR